MWYSRPVVMSAAAYPGPRRLPARTDCRRRPVPWRDERAAERRRRSSGRPRPCSTTTSTAACDRPRCSSWPPSTATAACPPPTSPSWRAGSTGAPDRNDLVLYLETFAHTRRRHAGPRRHRARGASECAEDLAADGVVYAEVRFAPEQHLEKGLTLDEVVDAVLEGFRLGSAGTGLTIYALLSAMRTAARSLEIAELAVRWRDAGVVGFDIAGAEAGHPPTRHLDAFQYVQRENFHATIHAGEAFGLPSHLGGAAVVRGRAARPRRAHRRRHRALVDGQYQARSPGRLRARPAHPPRDVPDLEREHRRVHRHRRATRSACCAGCASG